MHPWSKEYKYNEVLNGCCNTASAPDVTLSVAEAENTSRIKAITVFDVSGKKIVSKAGGNLSEDEVRSGLADGMYIMHFITEHDAYSKKIIK
jgi:hypothetical protein